MGGKNSSTFLVVLTFVVVAVIGVGLYLTLQNKSQNQESSIKNQKESAVVPSVDTSGWQTYKNDEYGFEFKYPEDILNPDYIRITNYNQLLSPGPDEFWFNLGRARFEGRLKNKALYKVGQDCLSTDSDITISYKEGARCSVINLDPYTFKLSYVGKHDGTLVQIIGPYFEVEIDQYLSDDIYKQILSTFKFTSSTNSVDTSTWQTYKNDEYGFKFSYPLSFKKEQGKSPGVYSSRFFDPNFIITLEFRNYEIDNDLISRGDVLFKTALVDGHESKIYIQDEKRDAITKRAEASIHLANTDSWVVLGVEPAFKFDSTIANEREKCMISGAVNADEYCFFDGRALNKNNSPDNHLVLLDQILKSFHVIQEKEISTSSWKTYKSDDYGFEFKYPDYLYLLPVKGSDFSLTLQSDNAYYGDMKIVLPSELNSEQLNGDCKVDYKWQGKNITIVSVTPEGIGFEGENSNYSKPVVSGGLTDCGEQSKKLVDAYLTSGDESFRAFIPINNNLDYLEIYNHRITSIYKVLIPKILSTFKFAQ